MKRQINLYGLEFRPRRQWAMLEQMALVWGCCLLVLASVAAFYAWQQQGVSRELAQVQAALGVKRSEAKRLDAELAWVEGMVDYQQSIVNLEAAEGVTP